MEFVPFHDEFPGIAEQETRTITVLEKSPLGLPPDDYGLMETFCNKPGCDCRRVMFQILSLRRQRLEAVVAWGWEPLEFYRRWLGGGDDETIEDLKGPSLNLGSPASELAGPLLEFVRGYILADERFVERVKRHYRMFKERIDGRTGRKPKRTASTLPPGVPGRGGRIPRNAPCPCGSGRKYKRCCGRAGTR